jgi:hypothetical protein
MLSAIIVIGSCAIVLAALCGLIAFVLMILNRSKMLFKAFRECGFTLDAIRDGFHAIVADAKARPGSYLLGVAIFCAFALFAEYILLGLVALGVVGTLLSVILRWGGSALDERLPTFEPSAIPSMKAIRRSVTAPRPPAEATSGLIRRASFAGDRKICG